MMEDGAEKRYEALSNLNAQREADQRAKINQVKDYYNSYESYPERVNDGWHSVIVTDNNLFVATRKVYVTANKITKYIVNDWHNMEIQFSGAATSGKAMIKVKESLSSREYLEVYFIEYLADPNHRASGPAKSGQIAFYSRFKKGGTITLYLDGHYIGTVDSFTGKKDPDPSCGFSNTVTSTYKEGTYKFSAKNEKGMIWQGSVTIYPGRCNSMELTKN